MLYRKIEALTEAHLKSDSNRILLIDGARQVGKTYVQNEDYHIKKAFVLSNKREIVQKGKTTYLPVYYIMFFQSAAGGGPNLQF